MFLTKVIYFIFLFIRNIVQVFNFIEICLIAETFKPKHMKCITHHGVGITQNRNYIFIRKQVESDSIVYNDYAFLVTDVETTKFLSEVECNYDLNSRCSESVKTHLITNIKFTLDYYDKRVSVCNIKDVKPFAEVKNVFSCRFCKIIIFFLRVSYKSLY